MGAVRHDGFIPWDDDIDIMMMRSDYEKLCSVAQKEFNHPYFFQTEYTDIGFTRGFARLRNSMTTAIQKYEQSDGYIHYNQGIFIDIFPLDNLPDDLNERRYFAVKAEAYKKKDMKWSSVSCRYVSGQSTGVKEIIKKHVAPILTFVFERCKIYNPYSIKYDKLCASLKDQHTEKLAIMWFYNAEKDNFYSRASFNGSVLHKFEIIDIMLPAGYEDILCREYGDWNKFVVGTSDHGELIVDTEIPYTQYIAIKEK